VKRTREDIVSIPGVTEVLGDGATNKSEKFLQLYELGLTVSEISMMTDSVYSFVWGRLEKRYGEAMRTSTGDQSRGKRAAQFIADWDAGATVGEIARRYNANYSYVWTVVDKHRKQEMSKKS